MKAKQSAILLFSAAAIACDDAPDEDDSEAGVSRTVTLTEVVSDRPGAEITDPELVNAWGLAFSPSGNAWVAATETGVARIYDASGNTMRASVEVPAATGQVFNDDPNAFEGDSFIFVTEQGMVFGWQEVMGGRAVERIDNSSRNDVYKGLAIVRDRGGQARLLVADFGNAEIDVFESDYDPIASDGFNDPQIPDGYAPFNIETMDDMVLVSYALQDPERRDDVPGAGNGYVNLFDSSGILQARLVERGALNSPWGMVLTPDGFVAAPNRLLVGNFGDGRINVYRLDRSSEGTTVAVHEGALRDPSGQDLVIDGLWALEFAPDAGSFADDQLWFTAGPEGETHGVFGRIESSDPGASAGGPTAEAQPSPRPTTPY